MFVLMLKTCDVHCCVSVEENALKTILQKNRLGGTNILLP